MAEPLVAERPAPEPTRPTPVDWRGLGRVIAMVTLAGLVAAACGVVTGTVVNAVLVANAPREDDWAELGAAILGLAAGLLVAAGVFGVGVVIGVRRTVPGGRRLRTALTVLACLVIGPTTSQIGSSPTQDAVRLVATTAALIAGVALIGAAAGVVQLRPALTATALALAVIICTGTVAGLRAPMLEEAARAERYARSGAPLALFDGTSTAPPVDGWTVDHVDQGWSPDDVTISFDDGSTSYPTWVELHLTRAPHPRSCERPTAPSPCTRLGERADGTVIWAEPSRYGRTAGGGSLVEAAWVDVPGGRWALDGTNVPQPIDAQAALEVLASLEPVDAATFTAAT